MGHFPFELCIGVSELFYSDHVLLGKNNRVVKIMDLVLHNYACTYMCG
jgi:hypothetical protein